MEGRSFKDVVMLPRESLRQGNQVLVVDQDQKLRTRMVEVLEANSKYIVVASGVEDGDVVNLSQLGIGVDGLLVETTTQTSLPNQDMIAASSSSDTTAITRENDDE